MPCPLCPHKDCVIKALKDYVKALETVFANSSRSLAAEGRQVKKARKALADAEGRMNPEVPEDLP